MYLSMSGCTTLARRVDVCEKRRVCGSAVVVVVKGDGLVIVPGSCLWRV